MQSSKHNFSSKESASLSTTSKRRAFKDRRRDTRRPDPLVLFLRWFSIACWLGVLIASVVLFQSQPEMDAGYMRFRGIEQRDQWIDSGRQLVLAILLLVSALSLGMRWLATRRERRKSDNKHNNFLWIQLLVAFLLLIVFVQ